MDFGVSTSGFEARLCHLIFYLFAIECCYSTLFLASATHPTLLWAPIFHQQEDKDNGFTFFNAGGLRFVNRHGGTLRRAGWVAFTKTYSRGKVADIAFTSDFCNNYSHCASPASLYLTSPRPILDVLKSLVLHLQVPSPHTRVPMSPSPCPCPTFIHSWKSQS